MSIQDELNKDELVEKYKHFQERKAVFENSITALNDSIVNIEAMVNYDTIADQSEKDDVTAYKNKITGL
jgi:hypothetical protein